MEPIQARPQSQQVDATTGQAGWQVLSALGTVCRGSVRTACCPCRGEPTHEAVLIFPSSQSVAYMISPMTYGSLN